MSVMKLFNIPLRFCSSIGMRTERRRISTGIRLPMNTQYIEEFNGNSAKYLALLQEVHDDEEEFRNAFPAFLQSVCMTASSSEIAEHLKELFHYNVLSPTEFFGYSGLPTYAAARMFHAKPEQITADELHLARILSWCNETYLGYICMHDDFVDKTKERNGKPAWHAKEGVENYVANDCSLVYLTSLNVLKLHFANKPYYLDLLHNHIEQALRFQFSMKMDRTHYLNRAERCAPNFDLLTMQNYLDLAMWKAGTPLHRPAISGLIMNGITDQTAYKQLEYYYKHLGPLTQAQNDAMDLLGLFETGTSKDINDGQFTWFLAKALEEGSSTQVKAIKENYGKREPKCVQIVKTVYEDLQLDVLHREYVETSLKELYAAIHHSSWKLPPHYFLYNIVILLKYDGALPYMQDLCVPVPQPNH